MACLFLPKKRETKTLSIADRRARRANHLLPLSRRGEGLAFEQWACLPVTSKQECEALAEQKSSLGNSLQDCEFKICLSAWWHTVVSLSDTTGSSYRRSGGRHQNRSHYLRMAKSRFRRAFSMVLRAVPYLEAATNGDEMLRIDEVTDSEDFPERCDVAVIGGGIVGVSTAYELARRGVQVTLLEKGVIGCEQSGRNWGWVRQQNRDLYELPLAMQSLKRWSELSEELGEDVGFRQAGILYGTEHQSDIAQWESWLARAREVGFNSEILSARELAARIPSARAKWAGGLWSATDGRAEPSKAAPAIARGAQGLGAIGVSELRGTKSRHECGACLRHLDGAWPNRSRHSRSRGRRLERVVLPASRYRPALHQRDGNGVANH